MKRAARVDENQADIVQALRDLGATVQPLHAVGCGCPDLLVGWRGSNFLVEVKNPDKVPSQQKLTPDQRKWHMAWDGQAVVIRTPKEAQFYLLQRNGKK